MLDSTKTNFGGLRRAVTGFAVFRRYWRLKSILRKSVKLIESTNRRHRQTVETLTLQKDREIRRLGELNSALQTKIEVVQREAVDKVLETVSLVGMSFVTRPTDDRIQDLRFKPFEEARREESGEKALYLSLAPEDQSAYDAEYDNHVALGLRDGLDMDTIKRNWKAHESQIVEQLSNGY